MSQPTVTAVMLTANRPELAARAVEAFRRQTYPANLRDLIILDTGDHSWWDRKTEADNEEHIESSMFSDTFMRKATIGELRNRANGELSIGDMNDIIVHWDDDDWSHPNRIAEQVALLQATGADCVGFNEMLFWDARSGENNRTPIDHEAWEYSNSNPRYALGTSLCYWRRAWEALPFPDLQHGEDTEWLKRVNCHAISAVPVYVRCPDDPPMVARIHSGNSSSAYDRAEMVRHNALPAAERQWVRAWGYDNFCREVMEC